MTAAITSQVVAEVLRSSTEVNAKADQVAISVIRKTVTPPDIELDQVVIEVIRTDLTSAEVNAQVDQIVAEIIRAERTLSASLPIGATVEGDLVQGVSFNATFDISLIAEVALELGAELAAVDIPLSVTMDAALEAEAVLSSEMGIAITQDAMLEKGVELTLTSSSDLTLTMRAALRVHPPESSSAFFLLF